LDNILTQIVESGAWLAGHPIWIIVSMLGILMLIGGLLRCFPSKYMAAMFFGVTVFSLFATMNQPLLPIVAIADIILVLVAAYDLTTPPTTKRFQVERQMMRVVSLRKPHQVVLTVSSRGLSAPPVDICDDLPQEFRAEPSSFTIIPSPRKQHILTYHAFASSRGKFEMHCVHLRLRSRLGLWYRYGAIPCPGALQVYPDLKQLEEYSLLARTNRLSLVGVRRTRRVGQDHDFERLRDYTPDDNYKHLDWRTTARRQKLTVKDFQTSQSQRVVFLIDCGRMMTNEVDGLSFLDHALNAALMLSYVALRQGDSVGMLCFSNTVHSLIPPKSGRSQMNLLLHAAFDRFPQLVESRYDLAFQQIAAKCNRRALVILITNVMDALNSQQIERHLRTLTGRHLPLAILLRDRGLFEAAGPTEPNDLEFYAASAASEILCWRQRLLMSLQHQGVLVIDAFPEQLTAPLVNRYLEIKARHLL
jgi:uncharacterized protein (DUF58 family)